MPAEMPTTKGAGSSEAFFLSYESRMKAEFNALTDAAMERALDMMGGLYSEAGVTHDRERARRAAEGLMANPALGGVWLIHVNGERVKDAQVGYLCVTLCYSLEFDGR